MTFVYNVQAMTKEELEGKPTCKLCGQRVRSSLARAWATIEGDGKLLKKLPVCVDHGVVVQEKYMRVAAP